MRQVNLTFIGIMSKSIIVVAINPRKSMHKVQHRRSHFPFLLFFIRIIHMKCDACLVVSTVARALDQETQIRRRGSTRRESKTTNHEAETHEMHKLSKNFKLYGTQRHSHGQKVLARRDIKYEQMRKMQQKHAHVRRPRIHNTRNNNKTSTLHSVH